MNGTEKQAVDNNSKRMNNKFPQNKFSSQKNDFGCKYFFFCGYSEKTFFCREICFSQQKLIVLQKK